MDVRPVRPGEYLAFTQLAADPREFRRELDRLIGFGYTAPRLWFLAERDGRPAAGAVYWTLPSLPDELMLLDLLLDFDRPDAAELGRGLLRDSLAALGRSGARLVEARLYSDSTDDLYAKKALYLAFGLPLIQEKEGFFRDLPGVPPPAPRPAPRRALTYKTLAETGFAAFIDAIAAVNARTLDRYDRWSSRAGDSLLSAEELFTALSDIDRRDDYWRLAYDETGLAGCLVPQEVDGTIGTVNYFGVVPDKRRRGYGSELFAAGVDFLSGCGFSRIVIDLDLENRPMIRIVERAGFRRDFRVWIFKAGLAELDRARPSGAV